MASDALSETKNGKEDWLVAMDWSSMRSPQFNARIFVSLVETWLLITAVKLEAMLLIVALVGTIKVNG